MTHNTIPQPVKKQLEITDRLNIDEKIRLPLAALWALGFYTNSSCQGHEDKSTDGPFIEIESFSSPELQEAVYSVEIGSDAFMEYIEELERDNLLERDRLFIYLREFYKRHTAEFDVRLVVEARGGQRSHLICESALRMQLPKYNDEYLQWLRAAQAEMEAFGMFLCDKIAEEG